MDAIYIRTSTDDQNPELQLKDCESMLKDDKTYELYKDKQSAWKDHIERESFERLKKEVKKGTIDNLYVWDLDRIYRNRKRLKSFFEYCKIYKCKIHSFRQDWLEQLSKIPEPFNEIFYEFLLQVMGWIGEDESNKKSERIKNAIRMKDDGAYSYKGNKWGRKEISTQAINKILILKDEGKTIRQICQEVTWDNGKNVSMGVVHKILSGKHRKIIKPETPFTTN